MEEQAHGWFLTSIFDFHMHVRTYLCIQKHAYIHVHHTHMKMEKGKTLAGKGEIEDALRSSGLDTSMVQRERWRRLSWRRLVSVFTKGKYERQGPPGLDHNSGQMTVSSKYYIGAQDY